MRDHQPADRENKPPRGGNELPGRASRPVGDDWRGGDVVVLGERRLCVMAADDGGPLTDGRGRIAVRNVSTDRLSYIPKWSLRRGSVVPRADDNVIRIAIDFHKHVEGEYGCPGASCPGVQRLAAAFSRLEGIGKARHAVVGDFSGVTVYDHGGSIVTIEPEMLAGRDIGERERKAIRSAIENLCGFIGDSPEVAPAPAGLRNEEEEATRVYPCAMCGVMRSKREGGTIFTVCDDCWDACQSPAAREERCADAVPTSPDGEIQILTHRLQEAQQAVARLRADRDCEKRLRKDADDRATTLDESLQEAQEEIARLKDLLSHWCTKTPDQPAKD